MRELRGMLEEMRERIEFFAVNPAEADEGPLWEIYRGMLASGVEKCLAAELLQEARRTIGEEQLSERLVGLEVMASLVMDRLSLSHPLGLDPNKRIVSALIGPSGVGKTTTVAKLAAELVLDRHRPLSLITVDTYRIGAVEQLATYANILNVPFEVVQNASAFEEAVKRQEGRDILVDTTGHSPKDMQMVDELRRLFNNGVKAQAHLPVSYTHLTLPTN